MVQYLEIRRAGIVGRAFHRRRTAVRWCTAALLFLGACDSRSETGSAGDGRKQPTTTSAPEAGAYPLDDVTAAAGIHFVHDKHNSGDFHVPEINGAGVGVLDFDNDGWYDLYFVQGGHVPGVAGGRELSDVLYRNRGDGRFEDVTEKAGIHETGYGMGVVCGDYNNDGWVDIYVYNVGPNTLLRNNGNGTFSDVTAQARVGDPGWGDGAAFLDYDADGWLDLFVCNYFIWDAAHEKTCTMGDTGQRDYCGPAVYEGQADVLYRNNGDGTFTNVTATAGIVDRSGTGMGVGVADFTGDGLLDIYVGNDARPNQLWAQRPDHTFVDRASEMLCDVSEEGKARSSMGLIVEDFNLDGRFDLVMGDFFDNPNAMLLNEGGMFRDVTRRSNLGALTRRFTTFGSSLLDLYNDGRIQLYLGNGKVNKANKVVYNPGDPYAERDLLLDWSYEKQRFSDITDQMGPVFDVAYVTRGTAVIDYDNDGDMDLVLAHNNGPARLLRCNATRSNHWLMVRAIGLDGQRDAYDVVVEVEIAGQVRRRPLYVASSYCSSSDPRVHFGLGGAAAVDRLTVCWLDGRRSTWRHVAADHPFIARYSDVAAMEPARSSAPH